MLDLPPVYAKRLMIPGFEIWPPHLQSVLEESRAMRARAAEELKRKEERADTPVDSEAMASDAASEAMSSRRNTLTQMSSAAPSPVLQASAVAPSSATMQQRQSMDQKPFDPRLHDQKHSPLLGQSQPRPAPPPGYGHPGPSQQMAQSQQSRGISQLVHDSRQQAPPPPLQAHRMGHSHSHSSSSSSSNPNPASTNPIGHNGGLPHQAPDYRRPSYSAPMPPAPHDYGRRESFGAPTFDPRDRRPGSANSQGPPPVQPQQAQQYSTSPNPGYASLGHSTSSNSSATGAGSGNGLGGSTSSAPATYGTQAYPSVAQPFNALPFNFQQFPPYQNGGAGSNGSGSGSGSGSAPPSWGERQSGQGGHQGSGQY